MLEAAEAAHGEPPWSTPHAVLVGMDAGTEVTAADALRPEKTHDCLWWWCLLGCWAESWAVDLSAVSGTASGKSSKISFLQFDVGCRRWNKVLGCVWKMQGAQTRRMIGLFYGWLGLGCLSGPSWILEAGGNLWHIMTYAAGALLQLNLVAHGSAYLNPIFIRHLPLNCLTQRNGITIVELSMVTMFDLASLP